MFQNIQSNKVNNVNILKEKYLDYKLNMLTELKNEIIKKNLKYANKMNNYLYFLKDKFYEEKDELHFLEKETFNNKKEFEKVIIKALKKQEELEYLINVRNFSFASEVPRHNIPAQHAVRINILSDVLSTSDNSIRGV